MAKRVWKQLLATLIKGKGWTDYDSGLTPVSLANQGNQKLLKEIPWINTNFTAQFCLNVIMALEFIRVQLPETLAEVDELLSDINEEITRA